MFSTPHDPARDLVSRDNTQSHQLPSKNQILRIMPGPEPRNVVRSRHFFRASKQNHILVGATSGHTIIIQKWNVATYIQAPRKDL